MRVKSVLACGAILFALAFAVQPIRAQAAKPGDQALIDLENRWVAALVRADLPTLDSILVATYVDTDEGGDRTNKQGMLEVFKSGDLKMNSIHLSDMKVYNYGGFAVVTGSAEQDGAYKGQKLAPRILFTDSFILRNGKWMVVASQRTAPAGM
jgi:hypothetical protein